MLSAAVRWSLRRARLVVYLCACFLVFGGLYAAGGKLDIFPPLAPARAVIQTQASGLVPEQVEQLVTRPIEEAVAGTPGVAAVHSESVQGLSMVTADFVRGANPGQAQQAVAARGSRVKANSRISTRPAPMARSTARLATAPVIRSAGRSRSVRMATP